MCRRNKFHRIYYTWKKQVLIKTKGRQLDTSYTEKSYQREISLRLDNLLETIYR